MAPPVNAPLDLGGIEAEIARVRERESSPFGGGAKANLFNLVIVSLAGARTDDAQEALLGRRPARIIRLAVGEPGPGEASVSGSCSPDALERGVCLEEIELPARGDPLAIGAGAWTPLLDRDIPTLFWIAGPWMPEPRPAFAYADKLIVDSSPVDEPLSTLAALHELRLSMRGRLTVADLAWSRLRPLRVHTARAFDPPEARDALTGLAEIRLEGGTSSEALLFFLWLAARLGWQATAGSDGPSFRDAAGIPLATVHDAPAPLVQGARLAFASRAGMRLAITCSESGCASVGDERSPWRIASDAELLLEEVDSLTQDAVFGEVLAVAGAAQRGPTRGSTA